MMQSGSSVSFEVALGDDDLRKIISLQHENLRANITPDTQVSQGFVTVRHDLNLLRSMNVSAAQVVAKDGDRLVGYALVMRPELKYIVPVLVPMFEMVDTLYYKGISLLDCKYYVMGQVCVDKKYRGMGIFDGLYRKHREIYSVEYDYCITEVSTRNFRSMRAHQRVGFKTIHTFHDQTDEWNIVLWDWKEK